MPEHYVVYWIYSSICTLTRSQTCDCTKSVQIGHSQSPYRIAANPGVTVHTELLGNPPGTFHGNQEPLTRTWEVWYAKDLGADVRIMAHDPNPEAGEQQTDLINVLGAVVRLTIAIVLFSARKSET